MYIIRTYSIQEFINILQIIGLTFCQAYYCVRVSFCNLWLDMMR